MIDPSLPSDIANQLDGRVLDEDTVLALRAGYPEVHFTACSDDDVLDPVKPVVERPGLRIYLVDGSEHCLSLTSDPRGATGLLLAEVEPDAWGEE
jgi:hypothetical protein